MKRSITFIILFVVTLFSIQLLGPANVALSGPLPEKFDLRDIDGRDYIGPVKNQNPYGTCYAFGATAAAESTYNRAKGLYNDNIVSFSESFIIWSLGQKYAGFPTDDYGGGGNYDYDEIQALVDYGIIESHIFPYTEEIMTAYNFDQNYELEYYWDYPRMKFAGWHRLPANDIETIKRAIMKFGAVDAAVLVENDFLVYEQGIYSDEIRNADEPLEFYSSVNHAIALVGWDDEERVWILRNSWGENWGEDGYMRIEYQSARGALEAVYLHYNPWTGVDHQIVNTQDINAGVDTSGIQPVSRGVYEWGGNNAYFINNAEIRAEAHVDDDHPYVHGMFLWAGDKSFIENYDTVHASASARQGQATAYGIALQGNNVHNSGSIVAKAHSGDDSRTTSYGIRMFGFDDKAILENTGSIISRATGADGWAYGLFSSNVPLIKNQGSIEAEASGYSSGIMAYNEVSIENTGSIESLTQHGNSLGIFISGGTLRNQAAASIIARSDSGQAYGVAANLYSIEFLENMGEIKAATESGSATGVGSNVLKNMHNSGSIFAEAKAKDSAATGVSLVGNQNLENSGTISAHNILGDAYGVELVHGNLINRSTGVIKAESTSGEAWGLILSASQAVNNGTVVGDTILEHDSLLMGNGLFTGNVDNKSGIVSPGNSIGTINITGDYTQGKNSVLEIEFDDNNSDKLVVSGTANLDGTLKIIPLGYVKGKSYSFFDAGSINGYFASYQSPAVFNIGINNIADNLSMDITRNSYASLTSYSSLNSMASTLDKVRPSAAGDMARVLNLMDSMQLPQLQGAFKDMYPGMNAAAGHAALQGAQRTQADLHRSLERSLLPGRKFSNPSNNNAKHYSLSSWGTITGSSVGMESTGSIPEFRDRMKGLMSGIDYNLDGNFTLGIAGAIAYQDLDQRGDSGSSTIRSYQAYLYSKWNNLKHGKGPYWNTSLGAGMMDIETHRSIAFLNRKTKSRHSAKVYSASTNAGYVFGKDKWSLRPGLNINYALLHEDSYSESRGGDLSLDIDSRDSQSLQSRLGISLSREIRLNKAMIIPDIRMHWLREFVTEPSDIKAGFKDSNSTFKARARKVPENSAILGLGFNARFSERIFGAVDYEYTFMESNQGSEQNISAQLKIRF